jgi:hypothetical protein
MIPGFLVGRGVRDRSERTRAAASGADAIAKLVALRDAGAISPEDFERQHAALLVPLRPSDQAPPNHRCGRCGKPLSPVWRGKCKHCGAMYAEFPPVPEEHAVR